MTDNPSPGLEPERKRSLLLSPVGIGAMALLGTGTFAATNGFGLGGRPCASQQIATTAAQCQALGGTVAACTAAFASGPQAIGLTRTSSSSAWVPQPLRSLPGGTYQTMGGAAFTPNSCTRSSSSRSSSSSFYWGGGSSGGSSSAGVSSGSSSVTRSGFGSTSRGFSGGG
ncbi:MAG: hypothetical protein JNK84_12770 [Phreatobacter sp.]|uniref:hypothetical protein n=1 Tax=Phreatobacter sp. TaxID=1966341 RepID=UPI001A3F7612|nr:hypothetical protein [Phreatobacter sp.]MBL8569937.1 hypothetical protein [Phreatobacter sp.]